MNEADHRPPLRRGIQGQSTGLLKSRARLDVLAFTGMDPGQLGRMTTERCVRRRGVVRAAASQEGSTCPPDTAAGRPPTHDSGVDGAFRRLVEVDGLNASKHEPIEEIGGRAVRVTRCRARRQSVL